MPIVEGTRPCVVPTCDKCGEGDNAEYGSSFHYESVAECVGALKDIEWTVFERCDQVYCPGCWDEMSQEERVGAGQS